MWNRSLNFFPNGPISLTGMSLRALPPDLELWGGIRHCILVDVYVYIKLLGCIDILWSICEGVFPSYKQGYDEPD